MTHVTLICTCGGSQAVPVDWMMKNPSRFVPCHHLKTVNNVRSECHKVYPVSEIYKETVDRGEAIYDAREKKQISMEGLK